MASQNCDWCVNCLTDPQTGDPYCAVELDEDEMALFLSRRQSRCPYYQPGDEYKMVQKQN